MTREICGLAHAGRVVSPSGPRKQIILRIGAPPPNPRDLSLFSSRMNGFLFTESASRSTIEMLDRRIRQRRDATRAPTQARNGGRPSGRPLDQTAAAFAAPLGHPNLCPHVGAHCRRGSRGPGPFGHFQNQIQERKSAAVRPPLHSLFRITLCWKREPDFRIILGLENAPRGTPSSRSSLHQSAPRERANADEGVGTRPGVRPTPKACYWKIAAIAVLPATYSPQGRTTANRALP